MRADVVPTATIRPPAARAAFSASAVAASIAPHSLCMTWPSVSSALTGRKVPAPDMQGHAMDRGAARGDALETRRGVKWSPAVGAATAPSRAANIVW